MRYVDCIYYPQAPAAFYSCMLVVIRLCCSVSRQCFDFIEIYFHAFCKFWIYFVFLFLPFHKFLEPNRRYTFKIDCTFVVFFHSQLITNTENVRPICNLPSFPKINSISWIYTCTMWQLMRRVKTTDSWMFWKSRIIQWFQTDTNKQENCLQEESNSRLNSRTARRLWRQSAFIAVCFLITCSCLGCSVIWWG